MGVDRRLVGGRVFKKSILKSETRQEGRKERRTQGEGEKNTPSDVHLAVRVPTVRLFSWLCLGEHTFQVSRKNEP